MIKLSFFVKTTNLPKKNSFSNNVNIFNFRDLEMHRSPSVNSVLSTGAGIGPSSGFQVPNSDPSTPSGPCKVKEKIPFEDVHDVHELLEEPVEEQVGQKINIQYWF